MGGVAGFHDGFGLNILSLDLEKKLKQRQQGNRLFIPRLAGYFGVMRRPDRVAVCQCGVEYPESLSEVQLNEAFRSLDSSYISGSPSWSSELHTYIFSALTRRGYRGDIVVDVLSAKVLWLHAKLPSACQISNLRHVRSSQYNVNNAVPRDMRRM